MAQRHASTANPRLIVPVPITLLQQMVLKRGRNASGATAAALNFRELWNLGEFWDQTAVPSGSPSCGAIAGSAATVAESLTAAITAVLGTAGAAGSRRAFLSATSLLMAAIELPILPTISLSSPSDSRNRIFML